MEQSIIFPLCWRSHEAAACMGPGVWPSTLTPILGTPSHRLPASFLRNPDGSKVCRAADSPGLGPLGALAWQTGRVG